MSAEDFNALQIAAGKLTPHHITALVRHWQSQHLPLDVDGAAGPATIASIEATLRPAASAHWLPNASAMPIHQSWFGGPLAAGKPLAIVAHYTATDPGTGVNMAKRRLRQFGADPDDRAASWHVTIETDGSVIQMIPLDHIAWHAGSDTAKPIPGVGWANSNTVGIELVGYGKSFPEAQVAAACRVWREIVQMYGIPRAHAMVTHQSIDPTRREDPGAVWMAQHATSVLDAAFA